MVTNIHLSFVIYTCHLQELLNSAEMYAFYSLLVYIFYTVFKKEEEEALEGACGASSDVCLATSWPAWGWMLGKRSYLRNMHALPPHLLRQQQLIIVLTFECIHKCKYFVYVLPSDSPVLLCSGARTCFHGNREQEERWPHLQNGKKDSA